MKLLLAIILFVADGVVAGPETCYSCVGGYYYCVYNSYNKRNQTCASDTLGTTHCGSASLTIRSYLGSYVTYFQGCLNCTDKRAACFAIGGYVRVKYGWIVLKCNIECCTGNKCNFQAPSRPLQNATTVFRPNAVGPKVCQRCSANDANSCTLTQNQFCGSSYNIRRSFGTTHCGSAKVKAKDDFMGNVTVSFIRGCIDCTDEKAACAIIAGSLKASKQWTVLECEIECCNGSNCNHGAANLTKCNYCIRGDEYSCTRSQTSQVCAQHPHSLGKTHCASVAGEYRTQYGSYKRRVFYRGCMDCADKRKACFALGGYLRASMSWILLKCDIKCCTNNNCNFDVPNLSNATTVFRPNVVGPRVCQGCVANNANSCTLKQYNQLCGGSSNFGTTHCGSAKVKAKDDFMGNVTVSFIRGCIDCTDEKAACGIIAGSLKARKRWTVLECEIECCNGSSCNDGAANLTKCNYCTHGDGNGCSGSQARQICSLDPDSLGTDCVSAVGYFRDQRGHEQQGFYRGCMNCAAVSKREACFTLGGFLKGDILSNGPVSLLRCELECCRGSHCNNQVPRLLPGSVTVFTPTVTGPSTCNVCLENDATSCSINQEIQVCATNPFSLGTTHCGSAVGRYRDTKGNIVDGFFRGCINCADKKAACAALGGFRKKLDKWTQLECDMECCIEDNCNTQIPCLA